MRGLGQGIPEDIAWALRDGVASLKSSTEEKDGLEEE
jgi:hypothetical protein